MKKINPIVVAVFLVAFAVTLTVVISVIAPIEQEKPVPMTIYEFPEEYFFSWNEDKEENKQDVSISCSFSTGNSAWEDEVVFPGLGVGKIWLGTEGSYFTLDDGKVMTMIQNSDNISTLYFYEIRESVLITWVIILYENKEEWDVVWQARPRINKKVTLPTGEEVIFSGFDPCTGNPKFSVIAG